MVFVFQIYRYGYYYIADSFCPSNIFGCGCVNTTLARAVRLVYGFLFYFIIIIIFQPNDKSIVKGMFRFCRWFV